MNSDLLAWNEIWQGDYESWKGEYDKGIRFQGFSKGEKIFPLAII
jgi:hypothetical protein